MNTSTSAPAAFSELAHHIARPERGSMPWRLSPLGVTAMAGAGEFAVLAITGLAVAGLWVGIEELVALQHGYALAILATALAAVLAAERQGLYAIATLRAPLRHLWRVGGCWTGAVGFLLGALFLLKSGTDFSRGWVLLWMAAGLGGMLAWRAAAREVVRHLASAGHLERRAVVYGAGSEGAELVRRLEADPDSDVRIVGVFDDRGTDRVPDSLAGYPMLGNADQLVAFCRAQEVDMLILSIPFTAERRLLEILNKLWVLPIDIRLAAHTTALRFRPRAYSHIGSVPMIDLFDRPLAEWDQILKSVFDRTIALLALLLLSPVMALVALAVRLDSPGPVLFRQKRLGFNNELIDVWKFRSMYVDRADANASRLVTRGDTRVTPVGRFIRRTSLDELPQLINVLLGTLSLVGPRPHALHAKAADRLYHEVVEGYFARHKVKPGITGLAQIRGWRGETDTEEKLKSRVASDLEYIDSWSLLLDLYILARTPVSLLKSENAY